MGRIWGTHFITSERIYERALIFTGHKIRYIRGCSRPPISHTVPCSIAFTQIPRNWSCLARRMARTKIRRANRRTFRAELTTRTGGWVQTQNSQELPRGEINAVRAKHTVVLPVGWGALFVLRLHLLATFDLYLLLP